MKQIRTLCLAVAMCCAVGFTGCIDFTEEFFFNADGTGRMIVDIAMSADLAKLANADSSSTDSSDAQKSKAHMMKVFTGDARVSNVSVRDTTFGNMQHTVFLIDAKSYNDLPLLHALFFADSEISAGGSMGPGKPSIQMIAENAPTGNTTVKLDFMIPRDTAAADTNGANSDLGESIANAMMGNSGFTFRVHAPKVTSANGTIDSAAHMVEWKIPLAGMKHAAGKTFHAEFLISGAMPTTMILRYGMIVGIAAAMLVALVMILRRRRKTAA